MTNYMVKSGSGRICFTNPAPAGFPKSKSSAALVCTVMVSYCTVRMLITFYNLLICLYEIQSHHGI